MRLIESFLNFVINLKYTYMAQTGFNQLPLLEKALLVEEFGIYLESIETSGHWIRLYSLNHLFVEVYCSTLRPQIDAISTIEYCDLDVYLSRIAVIGVKLIGH